MKMIAALLLMSSIAFAHVADAPGGWIGSGDYKSPVRPGEACCGPSDCSIVDAAVARVATGWRVRKVLVIFDTSGLPQLLPIDEVVPFSEATPSQDAHFWRCQRPSGERRCFFAPDPLTQ